MKTFRFALALALFPPFFLHAQEQPDAVDSAPGGAAQALDTAGRLTPEQLDQLLGPIALYPDALIALILPASTVPTDIVLAARYLKESNNDLSQVENRAWDDSVKSLTHYPEVLKWMDENLPWTKQLGQAFTDQPAEVMNAVQRLRSRAQANGALANTPQQQVVTTSSNIIQIVPTQPDVIYVPYYDPQIVYVERPAFYSYPGSFLSFSLGYGVGSWLAFDCDWHTRTIWVGDRHRRWEHHDWRRPLVAPPLANRGFVSTATVHPWRPAPRPPRAYTIGVVNGRAELTRANAVPVSRARAEITRPVPPLASNFGRPNVAASGPVAAPAVDRVDSGVPRPEGIRRDYTPGLRRNFSPVTPATVAPAPAPSPTVVPQIAAPAQTVNPLPRAGWQRENAVHPRPGPTYTPSGAPAPIMSAPALPMRTPAPAMAAPMPAPSYSRPAAAPAVAPLPQAAPAYQAAPAPAGPAPAPAAAPAQGDSRHQRERYQN